MKRAAEAKRKRLTMQVYCAAVILLILTLFVAIEIMPETAASAEEPHYIVIYADETEPDTVPSGYTPTDADKLALTRMVWGEARGCSNTEKAACVWCALNRFDSGDPYYSCCETIYDIVTQPGQFIGYSDQNPVDPDIWMLVEDVLSRWTMESSCCGDVGRVLPPEYLFFTGDGKQNYFTSEWAGGTTWDWSWDSPYEA